VKGTVQSRFDPEGCPAQSQRRLAPLDSVELSAIPHQVAIVDLAVLDMAQDRRQIVFPAQLHTTIGLCLTLKALAGRFAEGVVSPFAPPMNSQHIGAFVTTDYPNP
jgi:hypothetical protein